MVLRSVSIALLASSLYGSVLAAQDRQKLQEKPPAMQSEVRAASAGISDHLRNLEESARTGNAEAAYAIGELFRLGPDGDAATALMWYYRAAKKGNTEATRRVRELTQPLVAAAAQTPAAPATTSPSAAGSDVQSPGGRSPLLTASIAVAGISLLLSVVAVYFSWSRTRQALREAGLL